MEERATADVENARTRACASGVMPPDTACGVCGVACAQRAASAVQSVSDKAIATLAFICWAAAEAALALPALGADFRAGW